MLLVVLLLRWLRVRLLVGLLPLLRTCSCIGGCLLLLRLQGADQLIHLSHGEGAAGETAGPGVVAEDEEPGGLVDPGLHPLDVSRHDAQSKVDDLSAVNAALLG